MLIGAIFIAMLMMICINIPIAVALAMCGVLGLLATEGASSLVTIALDMYDGSTKFSLIAIPMFVLAGAIMNAGGITDRLINFVSAIIGFIRGGLAMVNIGVSLFFAEISGSAVADVAAMGSILIPQMKKRGYSKEFSAAVTSSSASLAIIIPPSIPMILYAASANTSVEQLFVEEEILAQRLARGQAVARDHFAQGGKVGHQESARRSAIALAILSAAIIAPGSARPLPAMSNAVP